MAQPVSRAKLHPFTRAVSAALRQRCGVKAGAALVVAVSGGADSVALLRALVAIGPAAWRLRLTVGHVNHGVRPEAKEDAAFVRALAGDLGMAYREATLNPAKFTGNVEAAMRRGRYAALGRIAGEAGASAIVTAHHADDQLETVLMRLVRGASVRGLAGLNWRRRVTAGGARIAVLRPMLAVTHEEAVAFLREMKQGWREDATNSDASRWRARLRRDVLPVLRELRGDAAEKAVELGDHLRDVSRVLAAQVDAAASVMRNVDGKIVLSRDGLRTLPAAVLLGVLRRAMVEAGGDADRLGVGVLRKMARVVCDARGGRRVMRVAGVEVEVTKGFVVAGESR